MIKRFLLLILLAFVFTDGWSQHCPWDGSSFIMLDIKNAKPLQVQKIYLLDSKKNIVITNFYYGDSVVHDTADFWKNPPQQVETRPYSRDGQYFRFAKDYQVLEFGLKEESSPYRVLIVYNSDNKIFRKEISVPKNEIHTLCTHNVELWSGKISPMLVSL